MRIKITLKLIDDRGNECPIDVEATAVPIAEESAYMRVLSDGRVRMGKLVWDPADVGLANMREDIQNMAIAALEREARRLAMAPDLFVTMNG